MTLKKISFMNLWVQLMFDSTLLPHFPPKIDQRMTKIALKNDSFVI